MRSSLSLFLSPGRGDLGICFLSVFLSSFPDSVDAETSSAEASDSEAFHWPCFCEPLLLELRLDSLLFQDDPEPR
uniref:Putative secreted protein n=1 Tax=Panstrongylus lignarius TaxID=156445 RepID=A0A224Y0H0_9HEMI